jgi:hypothetical protein
VRKNRWVVGRQRVSRGHDTGNTVSVHLANNTMRKQTVISLEKNNVTEDETAYFLPLDNQDIARENRRKHACPEDADAGRAGEL